MWKLFLSVNFYQICWLSLFAMVSTNSNGEEEWRIERPNYWTGKDSSGLQTLLPVTTLQQPVEEDLETSPARNALRVVPGPKYHHEASDQSNQGTMFLPKKEDEYRSQEHFEPSRAKAHIVTKWGHSENSHHSNNFPQEQEEDIEKSSSDPVYYAYEYKVHDPLTGDVKGHKELRDGDRVKGYYMLHDADGSMREVHYTADHEVGFTAVVSKTDDVAPPHKPKPNQDDIFSHKPKPPHKSPSFHGNKHQTHSSINHESTKDRPSQSFFTQPFHNPRDEHQKNIFNAEEYRLNSPVKSEFNYENDEEARHVEHFHPTPSYEDAYNNFAKKQPMPVLQEAWLPHLTRELNNDDPEEDHESFFGDDEDDFSPLSLNTQNEENYRPQLQVSQYLPISFHVGGHRSPRIHASEKSKDFSSFRPKGAGISITHKNNAHSFQFQDTHPTYETYEDERDYANDESRSTYAIAPSSKGFHINENSANLNSFTINSNVENVRPPINSTLLLTSLLPSSPTSFVPAENNYGLNEGSFNPLKKGPFKDKYNSKYGNIENNNFGRFGENIGEVESDISHHSKRNLKPYAERSQHDFKNGKWSFGSEINLESGFRPIANPFHSHSSDNSQFGSSFFISSPPPKNKAFRHTTSFSPDNSRFRSFKNNSYDFSRSTHFENARFPKNKLKKGFSEDGEFGKLPLSSNHGNKWGSDQLKGEYFDDFHADSPKHNYKKNSEIDESMHSLPKRETIKYRMKHGGYPRKGALRRGNKKPRITSIYDVMAYGGSDWPKKIRHSYNDKKKSRKVFRRFSNRRYNEGKKKRSVLPYEGYFPDRVNVELNSNIPQPPSLDYEYINTFPNHS